MIFLAFVGVLQLVGELKGTEKPNEVIVIDGSVTPTSLGVNPQVTILAIAEKNAEWIAEHFEGLNSP